MRQLRRSDLFVANGFHPAKSPVGAAPSASMPLLRSFGFWRFAIYTDAAPLALAKAYLALDQRQWADENGEKKDDPSAPPSNGRSAPVGEASVAAASQVEARLEWFRVSSRSAALRLVLRT